ncbi:MAG: EAL domain-containing protein [bacterium]
MRSKKDQHQGAITAGPDTMKVAVEAAGQAMFEFDEDTKTLQWADRNAIEAILGCTSDIDLSQQDQLVALIHPDEVLERQEAINSAKELNQGYTLEYRMRMEDGSFQWLEERGSWMRLGDKTRLIGMVRTIDAQKHREERLAYLATYDEFTGLLNRPRLRDHLAQAIDQVQMTASEGAYILIGIDNVGGINSDFGFDIADQVIVEVSNRLKSVLTDGATLGRVAGTKFGLVAVDYTQEQIRQICNAIMMEIRKDIFDTSKGGIAVTVTVGVAQFNADKQSIEQIMAEAEAALDEAKRMGPCSWAVFSEKTETVTLRNKNTELSDVILTALNERRVVLAYQPIVGDVAEDIQKYECLIRMQGEDGREVPAPDFVPAAERLGLVHLLDRRVLELAILTLKENQDIKLNVNVSWETVKDPVSAQGYVSHLRANSDVADRVTVELTETQVVDAIEASIEFVTEIKELGCDFAIDDFGAGYTSFRNLKALDIDVLKIDGSFVTGVSSSRENQLFVRTLLDLARNFGMKTVAEWVDNEADAVLLKGLGVDFLQGYFIGKPEQTPNGLIIPSAKHKPRPDKMNLAL